MDNDTFTSVPFSSDAAASAHLGGTNFHGQAPRYEASSPHDARTYRGRPYQHQYLVDSSFQGSNTLSQRRGQSNTYPESSQRTLLRETMRDNMVGLSGFDAPHLGNAMIGSSSSRAFNHFGSDEMPPSPLDDHPSSPSIRFGHTSRMLPRKLSDPQYPTMQIHSPSDFYSSSLSQAMTYHTDQGSSSAAESPVIEASGQTLASFSQVHRNAENKPPHDAASYQALPSGNERLSGTGAHFMSSHVHQPPSHPIPQPIHSSIPMRKASSEWMTQSGFLSVSEHGTANSHERYTSPAVAIDAHIFSGAGANASVIPQQDAKSFVGQSAPSPSLLHLPQDPSKPSSPAPPEEVSNDGPPPKKKKKSKMHACEICDKKFPRPSGLRTHMNTHNNARPYPCGFPGCTRTFGVRSNAKRHLRTHGVVPPPPGEPPTDAYVVGFSPPVVVPPPNHQIIPVPDGAGDDDSRPRPRMGKAPFFKLRWMPPSLTSRNNAALLKSVSENGEFSDDEEDDEEDLDSLMAINGRHSSRSLSDTSIPLLTNSSSSSSSAAGSPECTCPIPCTSSPCLSLIAADLANSFPNSSDSMGSFTSRPGHQRPRSEKSAMADEPGYPSSQVDSPPSSRD